jgi:hypothetical protein
MTAEVLLVVIFLILAGVSAACVGGAFYQHRRSQPKQPAPRPRVAR